LPVVSSAPVPLAAPQLAVPGALQVQLAAAALVTPLNVV